MGVFHLVLIKYDDHRRLRYERGQTEAHILMELPGLQIFNWIWHQSSISNWYDEKAEDSLEAAIDHILDAPDFKPSRLKCYQKALKKVQRRMNKKQKRVEKR